MPHRRERATREVHVATATATTATDESGRWTIVPVVAIRIVMRDVVVRRRAVIVAAAAIFVVGVVILLMARVKGSFVVVVVCLVFVLALHDGVGVCVCVCVNDGATRQRSHG